MNRLRTSSLVVGLLALTVTGCDGFVLGCTEIGCGSTLVVDLAGIDSVGARAMTLQLEGEDPIPMHCEADVCVPAMPSWNEHPDEFTLTLELPDTTISRSFDPSYRSEYPNGRSCGPECRSARVTFTVE